MSSFLPLTHHATLFVHPNRNDFAVSLWNELQATSPAHVFQNHTVLDIDTARTIISWANTSSVEKIALLSFHTITLPAQNALLKILEEPQPHVKFILVTSNRDAIIPTLYSRLQEKQVTEKKELDTSFVVTFLATTQSKRMQLKPIVALLAQEDEAGRKDREAILSCITSLAITLKEKPEYSNYTSEILEIASYVSDPSSSSKSLLEYLALVLPQMK